jgi:hypothetical protein
MNAPSHTHPALESSVGHSAETRSHAFLYFRCAVRRAPELFRLGRPLPGETVVRLTRRLREMGRSSSPETDAKRVYSIFDRLLAPSVALDPFFLKKHEGWYEAAQGLPGRVFHLKPEENRFSEPEEQCEFLYSPGLQRCYTLVWRWLSVLTVGKAPSEGPIALEDCNWIQDRMREGLGLEPGTLLELYPSWVVPWRAEALWARGKAALRSATAWNYRFKTWEETPE